MNDFRELARECERRSDCDGELYGESSLSRSYRWDGESMESSELERDAGAGLRLLAEDRVGFAYANRPRLDAANLVDRARAAWRLMDPEPHRGLSSSTVRDGRADRWYDEAVDAAPDPRVRAVEDVLAAGMAENRVHTLQGSYSENRRRIALYRGGECLFTETFTRYQVGVWAVCTEGDEVETGYEHQTAVTFEDLNLRDVLDDAIERGRRQLESRPPDSRTGPAILAPRAASGLLRLARRMLDGEAVVHGRSAWSTDRMGEPVAAEKVTLRDDPARESGGGNRTFDAEGYRLEPIDLVKEGRYRRCLSNEYLNRLGPLPEVHRASRGYRSRPGVGTTNFYLAPGEATEEELYRRLGEGPVVTEIQPGSGLDPVSGHFSVGAKGYFLDGGQFQRPFTEGTISGDFDALLKGVRAVGASLPDGYATASPALLVEELSLGGGGDDA